MSGMTRRECLVAAGAFAVALPGGEPPAAAQTGNSSLSGLVTYEGGEPAAARIYYAREGKYRQTTSRFRGGRNQGFSITGMLPGRYELVVTAPGAKPKRIWGVVIAGFEKKELPVVLQRGTPEEEMFFVESGVPIREDMPRDWSGAWVTGILLNEQRSPVEGDVHFYRAGTNYLTIPAGSPTLPAYFETREIPAGTWDIHFKPTQSARVKPVVIEQVPLEPNKRTIVPRVIAPAGFDSDVPYKPGKLEIVTALVPLSAPRRR